jgi:hypothetical protein
MAALAAPELEIDQRHIAVAAIDQPLQIGITRSQARSAGQQQPHVSSLQCGPGVREVGVVVGHHRFDTLFNPLPCEAIEHLFVVWYLRVFKNFVAVP